MAYKDPLTRGLDAALAKRGIGPETPRAIAERDKKRRIKAAKAEGERKRMEREAAATETPATAQRFQDAVAKSAGVNTEAPAPAKVRKPRQPKPVIVHRENAAEPAPLREEPSPKERYVMLSAEEAARLREAQPQDWPPMVAVQSGDILGVFDIGARVRLTHRAYGTRRNRGWIVEMVTPQVARIILERGVEVYDHIERLALAR